MLSLYHQHDSPAQSLLRFTANVVGKQVNLLPTYCTSPYIKVTPICCGHDTRPSSGSKGKGKVHTITGHEGPEWGGGGGVYFYFL